MPKLDEIEHQLRGLESAKIFFTDLNGRPLGLPINPDDVRSIMERGIGFDGSSIAGISTVDDSDRLLFPVAETFRLINFTEERQGFLIGRIFNHDGKRSRSDARGVLERVLEEAEASLGVRFLVGPEHEFFLLTGDEVTQNHTPDRAGYFDDNPHDKGELVRRKIIRVLKDCGVRFEKAHHEVTPSQHEINLVAVDPLWAADRTLLFNYVTQKVAAESGYYATFMSKPFDNTNRNAFHIHLSIQDEAGNNLCYDAGDEHHFSQLAKHFIGGILKYARETSIIMASTYNSYKAYVPEREAPMVRGWGVKNRSSMVRQPYSPNPQSTRFELRSPDPAGNVYLQLAVYIAMGVRGIKEEIDCGPPDVGNTYRKPVKRPKLWDTRLLPKSMFEALVEAEKSEFLPEVLGEHLYGNLMELKTAEWEAFRTAITPREHQVYIRY